MSEHHTVNLDGSDGNALGNQKAGLEGSTKTSKKRTRDSHAVAKYKSHITNQEKAYKRIVTSVTQPSTLLGLGLDRVRPVNRVRLCSLLLKLMRQHNMVEASGVLSILLKGTCKDKGSRMNHFKYSVSMELLKHLEFNDVQLTSIDRIYDTWMTRIGIDVSSEGKKNGFKEEDGIAVRLESILYQFAQGKIEGERQNARSVMRENDYNYYPLFNVIMGLIFYQLFYSSLPEEMQYKDFDEIHSPTNSDMSDVASQLETSATKVRYEIGVSDHNALFNDESESSFLYDSETSVMDGKEMLAKASDDIKREVVSMEADFTQQRDLPQGFYVNSAENEASADNNGGLSHSIRNLSAHNNLESWLLPFQSGDFELGKIHDHEFEQAVGYLQAAVSTTPPSLAALLPLIQLLLIRCQYKEAPRELEKFSEISNAALPTRLRGCLLEHVDPHDNISLSTSYEDTLKRDPTCNISLSKLISMHQNGGEMKGFVRYNSPKLFIHGKTGKAWRLRSRWWLTRHFSKSQLASEMASGDMRLPTYKAACASHMYDQGLIML